MAYANMQQLVSHWSTIIQSTENTYTSSNNTRKKRGREDDYTTQKVSKQRAQHINTTNTNNTQ